MVELLWRVWSAERSWRLWYTNGNKKQLPVCYIFYIISRSVDRSFASSPFFLLVVACLFRTERRTATQLSAFLRICSRSSIFHFLHSTRPYTDRFCVLHCISIRATTVAQDSSRAFGAFSFNYRIQDREWERKVRSGAAEINEIWWEVGNFISSARRSTPSLPWPTHITVLHLDQDQTRDEFPCSALSRLQPPTRMTVFNALEVN